MQKELSSGPLLNSEGNLNEAGFSFSLIKEYKRNDIKAHCLRIKEWDYYYIGDENFGVALTVADNSYMGLVSVSVLDFNNLEDNTKSYLKWFTLGRLHLPNSSLSGDINVKHSKYNFSFINDGKGNRHIIVNLKNLTKGKDFACDIELKQTNPNSMCIATPFKKSKHFYYNQKINCLKAKGTFTFGDIKYKFKDQAYGVLDWGRGVWTYSNTWYWSSLNGYCDGHVIGFNLGYGFGDTSNASENMLFVDDKAYKLEDVSFNIPTKKKKLDFLSIWTLTSKDNKINLTFTPLIDRYSNSNILLIQSLQHQVFGIFNGKINADGREYKITNLIGFAEKVKNRW